MRRFLPQPIILLRLYFFFSHATPQTERCAAAEALTVRRECGDARILALPIGWHSARNKERVYRCLSPSNITAYFNLYHKRQSIFRVVERSNDAGRFEAGKAEGIATLCKIFLSKKNTRFLPKYIARFYQILEEVRCSSSLIFFFVLVRW